MNLVMTPLPGSHKCLALRKERIWCQKHGGAHTTYIRVPKVWENGKEKYDSHAAKKGAKKLVGSNCAKNLEKKVATEIRETCKKTYFTPSSPIKATNSIVVLSILLSRRTKNKEWCFLCKWRQYAWKDSLFENYELSLRLTNEVSTDRSEHVYRVRFCAISYVWGCGVKVSALMPEIDPTSCTRVNVQDVSWTGSIT